MTTVTAIRPPYLELALTVDRSEGSRARQAVTRALCDLGHAGLVDDACVIVSELVTNAIVETEKRLIFLARDFLTTSRIKLRLYADSGRIVVEVWDELPDKIPRPRLPDIGEEGGRGLNIVAQLSAKWGYSHTCGWKRVWALLEVAS
ncbi:ATP-binding protein [Actinomadura fibrosa]|uniref:ATP-binding protein n=1 Tax=Actinomadura fibrosa TaxID=111802 RepID=A0ABW2XD17_9ACTN|nr:ATP-binding protein [Actinomadura fibrosa]